jgi:ATP synthase protein I
MFLAIRARAHFEVWPRISGVGHMAEDESEREPTSPQDARLTSLDERLKRAERVEDERRPGADSRLLRRSAGSQLAQNLVGMPFGGFVVGFLFDQWFGTVPWIALALMFIGFAGGVLQLMKAGKQSPDKDAGKQ